LTSHVTVFDHVTGLDLTPSDFLTMAPAVAPDNTSGSVPSTNDASPGNRRIRSMYSTLFHEMQFRASKNALMNYYQAGVLDEQGQRMKQSARILCAVSSAGLLAGLVQKGKVLADRFGVAGLAGMPIAGAVEIFSNTSSDFLPSHAERAKKHIQAAAKWNRIAEKSKVARLRILNDPAFTIGTVTTLHEQLLDQREAVAASVVIPRHVHRQFEDDEENVFASIKKRELAFNQFKKFHLDGKDEDEEEATYYL